MKPTIDLDAARNKLVGGKDQLLKKIDEHIFPLMHKALYLLQEML